MREYTVISPVDHDGKHFAIGDPITLDALAAAPLLAVFSISAPDEAAQLLSETLRGSEYLPILIRITKDLTVPQTEIVERAFVASGLDRAGWNGLSDDDRELRIASSVELVRQQSVDTRLDADERSGIGHRVAAAEGARVMQDNQVADPQAAAAERVVVEHVGGGLGTGTDAVQTGTAIAGADVAADASASATGQALGEFGTGTVAETAASGLVIDGTAAPLDTPIPSNLSDATLDQALGQIEGTTPADAVAASLLIDGVAETSAAPAETTIVVDPVAATHTHTPTDGAPRRGRRGSSAG